jgi:class 3 adenylate cyclase/tetratricopeptide (TPR) repeat protein
MVNCPGCGEENPPKFRLCGYCGTPLAPQAPAAPALPAHEVRKTVTIVFSDLKGSTALTERLDPEAMREVTDRYFAAMAAEITRHGGKIEKYIGDAIMAVFGLPRAHEDDALRAVRAAAGMQVALQKVNEDLMRRYGVALANRTGVNTGEVVANDDPNVDQKLATGDAVNVAARLEQAAPENQVYLGESTYRLVRDAVEVEAVDPLELKGKAEKVPAYRLVSALGLDGYARRQDAPIVGRDEEIAALHQAYRASRDECKVQMVTIVGDAGQGKSRLAREVIQNIAQGARVLRGRCLPYGDGITFWPLVGIVWEAAGILADDSPDVARGKLLAVAIDADVAARLESAVGLSLAVYPMHELYWALRKLLEGFASRQPVVVLVDDIHWAEPAFLELLEHVLDASGNAPVLILTTARYELLEAHPKWGDRAGSSQVVLRPLTDAAAAQVVENLLGSAGLPRAVVDSIVTAAEGNPLYVEQMLSMLIDSDALRLEAGRWVRADSYVDITVPPTIQALLESRLDNLSRADRAAVEPASVIGQEFARAALEALAPEVLRPVIGEHLSTLARKHFIRPAAAAQAESIYRFNNHLVRETVYNGLLKRARANLHIGFVRWADKVNADRDRALEFQEILGYHLEQAYRYLSDLGPLDDAGVAIGVDAAGRLSSAGRRAFARSDMHAAANLLRRATALLAEHTPARRELLPELGEALMELGEFDESRSVLAAAVNEAERAGDERIRASATLIGMFVRLYSGEPGDWGTEASTIATATIPALEAAGAHAELATAWRLVGFVHGVAGRYSSANEATVHYMAHARKAGNARLVARSGLGFAIGALSGPMPVPAAIVECERIIAEGVGDRQVQSVIMCVLAQLRAMNGEFAEARRLYTQGRNMLRELGQGVSAASTGIDVARVELLAGDLATAECEIRADYEFLKKKGETYLLSTLEGMLSRVVRDQGRDEEALALSKAVETAAAQDDVEAQVQWRSVRAPILARAGHLAEAEALARSAVALASTSEAPALQAETLTELAAVLKQSGEADEARIVMDQAEALFRAKGDVISAARAAVWTPDCLA